MPKLNHQTDSTPILVASHYTRSTTSFLFQTSNQISTRSSWSYRQIRGPKSPEAKALHLLLNRTRTSGDNLGDRRVCRCAPCGEAPRLLRPCSVTIHHPRRPLFASPVSSSRRRARWRIPDSAWPGQVGRKRGIARARWVWDRSSSCSPLQPFIF